MGMAKLLRLFFMNFCWGPSPQDTKAISYLRQIVHNDQQLERFVSTVAVEHVATFKRSILAFTLLLYARLNVNPGFEVPTGDIE
jgi:hypothetical protein